MDTTTGTDGARPEDSGRTAHLMSAGGTPSRSTDGRLPHRHIVALVAGGIAAAAILGVGTGLGAITSTSAFASALSHIAQAGTPAQTSQMEPAYVEPWDSFDSGGRLPWNGEQPPSNGNQTPGNGGQFGFGDTGTTTLPAATAAQQVGVVDINTVLGYRGAEAAGTGIVLTSDGEILTNNHVVAGSTSITVTDVTTGTDYTATVVGTDATEDVAVLQLSGASGLTPANIDSEDLVAIGDAVTGVGNAGGKGGTPSASAGTVTALDQTITTQAEAAAASETLTGLIETDADIRAGDSGGPLYNAEDEVIGIDTAAEVGSGETTAGYAIPISTALAVADQIESGQESSTVDIGYPAFLGVEVGASGDGTAQTPTAQGAYIGGVIESSPAAAAGLTAGDSITAVNGMTIGSSADLKAALSGYDPGQSVTITWLDASGGSQSATVTLAQGPAA